MNSEMFVDMRGFDVIYKDKTYSCLQIHPYNEVSLTMGDFTYCDVEMLRVVTINQEGRFEILDDVLWEFRFIKE